jgi:hypothetical protein
MSVPFAHGEFVHSILTLTGILLIVGAALGLTAGIGLLQRQPWARMLAIILGVISPVDVPFGTALGPTLHLPLFRLRRSQRIPALRRRDHQRAPSADPPSGIRGMRALPVESPGGTCAPVTI